MRINENIPALHAFTAITVTNRGVERHMRNIATGFRINSVSDDSAGMAISQKMRTQLRALEQSARNSLDGVSLVQTAEGALQEVHNMIHRIRELAVQSSNDTNTAEDRQAIDNEVQQLIQEIDAITDRTEFNKIRLLNGAAARLGKIPIPDRSVVDMTFVSDNISDTRLTYSIESFGLPANYAFDLDWNAVDWSAHAGQSIVLNGERFFINRDETTDMVIQRFQELLHTVNLNFTVLEGNEPGEHGTWQDVANGEASLMLFTKEAGTNQHINIEGDASLMFAMFGASQVSTTGTNAVIPEGSVHLATGEPLSTSAMGNRIELRGNAGRHITLELHVHGPNSDGFFFIVDNTGDEIVNRPILSDGLVPGYTTNPAVSENKVIDILNFGTIKLQIGPNHNMFLDVQIPSVNARGLGLEFANVRSWEWAQRTITLADRAMERVSAVRTRLGAYQNRLEHTVASLNVANENTSASLSRVFDADIAWEMTRLSSLNVIAQAGMAIMAQANQRPQQLLQLVR